LKENKIYAGKIITHALYSQKLHYAFTYIVEFLSLLYSKINLIIVCVFYHKQQLN